MTDIKRMNELHAAGENSHDHHERAKSRIALFNAWPAVAARLKMLEKFVQMVCAAHDLPLLGESSQVGMSLMWLDAETKKAGE